MDKEKEIEEMIEVLKNKHFEKNLDEYIADIPRAICSALVEAGYRKADEVRKEMAKEIYERVDKWLDEIVPHTREETILICLLGWIKTKFGIEVDE